MEIVMINSRMWRTRN